MRLSAKGRDAVMGVADPASNVSGGPVAPADIAARQGISLSYLEQLFGGLRKGALVKRVRGSGGGCLLSRDAAEIRISDIIFAVDEPIGTARGASGRHHNTGRRLTHDLWEEMGERISLYLSAVTLDQVVNRHGLAASGVDPRSHLTAQGVVNRHGLAASGVIGRRAARRTHYEPGARRDH